MRPTPLAASLLLAALLPAWTRAESPPAHALPAYEGREPDAPWRTHAAASIERHRKAPIVVTVRDEAGFPVPGAVVEVVQARSAFAFGSAVRAERLLGTGPDDRHYQSVVTNWFNTAVLENDLKWREFEANPARARQAVDWLGAHGIAVRGHNLVWPGTNTADCLPPDVVRLLGDPAALRGRIRNRITNAVTAFAGRLADWDVVNEPLHADAVGKVLGRQEMADWFSIAHALDPAATPCLNEYGNLESPGPEGTTRLRALAEDLRSRGAPLDVLGLQAHFGPQLTPPAEVLSRLDLLSGVNPKADAFALRITEFDVDTADEALQADYTRDLLTAAFSHPSVNGFLAWGFWEGQHWRPRAAMFRTDWQPRPAALMWSNLTQRAWTTRTNLRTSASGVATVRGFKGDYMVRVRAHGVTRESRATVLADTQLLTVLPVVVPELSVTPGDPVRFTWPATAAGYVLEWTESLASPDWRPVEVIPVQSALGWRLELPPTRAPQYYRLRRDAHPAGG